jgi:hypothetical protein
VDLGYKLSKIATKGLKVESRVAFQRLDLKTFSKKKAIKQGSILDVSRN